MPKLPTKYRVEYTDGFGKRRIIYDLKEGGELLDLKIAKAHAEEKVKKGAIEAKLYAIQNEEEKIALVCTRGSGKSVLWKDTRK